MPSRSADQAVTDEGSNPRALPILPRLMILLVLDDMLVKTITNLPVRQGHSRRRRCLFQATPTVLQKRGSARPRSIWDEDD